MENIKPIIILLSICTLIHAQSYFELDISTNTGVANVLSNGISFDHTTNVLFYNQTLFSNQIYSGLFTLSQLQALGTNPYALSRIDLQQDWMSYCLIGMTNLTMIQPMANSLLITNVFGN